MCLCTSVWVCVYGVIEKQKPRERDYVNQNVAIVGSRANISSVEKIP